MAKISIHVDGQCADAENPGPGGFAAVLVCGSHRKELSGGYQLTTRNRMELMSAIVALESVKGSGHSIDIHSDSRDLAWGMAHGWARRWQQDEWRMSSGKAGKKRPNRDLWERLLLLTLDLEVRFLESTPESSDRERCAALAGEQSQRPVQELEVDAGFIAENAQTEFALA